VVRVHLHPLHRPGEQVHAHLQPVPTISRVIEAVELAVGEVARLRMGLQV
jgi:hypothetical protein